jgi:hypothetical protein
MPAILKYLSMAVRILRTKKGRQVLVKNTAFSLALGRTCIYWRIACLAALFMGIRRGPRDCCDRTYTIFRFVLSIFGNDFDILYSSNEFGNDIVPSLLVWDDLKDKNYNNIIKIHTKSNINILNKSLDFLLNNNINEIKLLKNNESSCIGYKYINMENDIFNKNLIYENKELINNNYFVPYTIFLTEENIMNKVLTFFKNNNKIIFLQNMYDTNMINRDYSYVHFMERLFGYS